MSTYNAPVRDMQFAIEELADLKAVAVLAGCEDATPDLVNSVLEEAAKFAGGVWAPLDRTGDVEGARWNDGHVAMPDGFHAAYRQFVEAGWNGLRFGAEYGGQGLSPAHERAFNDEAVQYRTPDLGAAGSVTFEMCGPTMLVHGSPEFLQRHIPSRPC